MEFAKTVSFSGNTIAWTPLSLGLLFLGVLIILRGPRKWVLPTFLALSTLMSLALHIVVLGFALMPYRVLLLAGWARVLLDGEQRGFTFSAMDKTFLFLSSWMVVTETLLGGGEGFVYGVANYVFDALGIYFLCRMFLRDQDDLWHAVKGLAATCFVVAAFMCVEYVAHRNLLSALGAVQDAAQERKGRMRCAASFSIAITAGTFGAALLPLFIGCWWQRGSMKKWAVPGCIGATFITIASGSAGPLSTWVVAILALLAWRLRDHMRKIRWATLFMLIALHMVMKAPVWALIARLQVVPGASAWHRFNVIDAFIRNVGQWWAYGVVSTADWGWFVDDVANQFCIIAKHGGMLALLLFIRLIWLGFREVGTTVRDVADDRSVAMLAWSFGAMLFAHVTSFFGISYYDQIKVTWFANLAMLASVGYLKPQEAEAELQDSIRDIEAQKEILEEAPTTAPAFQ
jgi:hypothetical protein